jgi:hypothetical protein
LLFARPPVLDAARVKENWFSTPNAMIRPWQTELAMSTGKFCRFSSENWPQQRGTLKPGVQNAGLRLALQLRFPQSFPFSYLFDLLPSGFGRSLFAPMN